MEIRNLIKESVMERFEELKSNNLEFKMDINLLKEKSAIYNEYHEFNIGDIVEIKPGINSGLNMKNEQPCIVVEKLSCPISSEEKDSGDCRFNQKLDIKIGVVMGKDDYREFYFNSLNFQPYTGGNQENSQ